MGCKEPDKTAIFTHSFTQGIILSEVQESLFVIFIDFLSTLFFCFFFFPFIFISWRLITSQHFSGFCHILTWISHGVTCIPLKCYDKTHKTYIVFFLILLDHLGFRGGWDSNASACNAGDPGLIPGSGRSPGEANGYPLQYSCPENRMDRGAYSCLTMFVVVVSAV